ncbi:MAG: hypothetical protein SH809_12980 [Rhodothermales bacterium]|nr:hypothetical protein [Rhodothermales bacterium]
MVSPIIKKDRVDARSMPFEDMPERSSVILRGARVMESPGVREFNLDRRIIRGEEARFDALPMTYIEISQDKGHGEHRPPAEVVLSTEEQLALQEAGWEKRLKIEVEAARDAGYEAGRRETTERLETAFTASRQALLDDTSRIQRLWGDLVEKSEPILLEMTLDLLEAILHQPLPEPVVGIVENALLTTLEVFSRDIPIRLSLNSIDYLRLQESGLVMHVGNLFPKLVWDPQPDHREGDWIAHSPEMMIRSIVSEAIQHLKDRFGLLEPHSRTARASAQATGDPAGDPDAAPLSDLP